jgi:hypothetical protein
MVCYLQLTSRLVRDRNVTSREEFDISEPEPHEDRTGAAQVVRQQ